MALALRPDLPSTLLSRVIVADIGPGKGDASIRAFPLTNISFPEPGGPVKFRVPVDVVKDSLEEIGGFPYEPDEREWHGKTLIIKGSKSK
ncbi:hypothetical protein M422DRAFT_265230 [Sphaerobolus stellatus SS14]|uniref:Uncharacterized protein n=1 Tax=Sphaerobolus stellatus (strain SS14) TaxID=990650 RepID=A0A0C9UUH0_SPHS4|nr:hypothetical protein M422DRAFT_265230 [Sphaerobolus stellatus SS14]